MHSKKRRSTGLPIPFLIPSTWMLKQEVLESDEGQYVRLEGDLVDGKVKILVEEVCHGSQEQTRGIEQVAGAIIQMEMVTQTTAASAEESAAAAQELSSQANRVRQIVEQLTLMVDHSCPS